MHLPLVQPPLPQARLPALAARWTEAVLGALPPAEQRTTCEACVKLPNPGEPLLKTHFNPATKCCTYLPVLHNFQVGALLDDPQVAAAGRASVERRIDGGEGVTPTGLIGTAAYYSQYGDEVFGKEAALLCPHYLSEEGGRCGVWQHRNATCSTWYCRTDRGAASFAFWRHGLAGLLRAAEDVVAEWAVFALGADGGAEGQWGPWADPRAFYRASARLADRCTWDEVLRLGGGRLQTMVDQARATYGELLAAPRDPDYDPHHTRVGARNRGAKPDLERPEPGAIAP